MRRPAGAALLALLAAGPAWAACAPHGGAVVLTVAGDADHANRPGNTALDQFHAHQSNAFGPARAFDADALGRLPSREVALVLPYDHQPHVFSGPPLATVLAEAGAAGSVSLHGIDGYAVAFTAAELAALDPVLALCRDGAPLGIGDLGPAVLVFAPQSGPGTAPSREEFHKMVWGVYFIGPLQPR